MTSTHLYFWKMHGAGNDFVVLDAIEHPLPATFDFAATAQQLCRRHFHAGGDGLLLLERPDAAGAANGAAIRMRMWNPDGSEDMCGNGLRCIAHLAHRQGHVPGTDFGVQTLAGHRAVEILPDSLVRVQMGAPLFSPRDVPMQWPHEKDLLGKAIEYMLPVGGVNVPCVSSLSTGSTHTVIFSDAPIDDAQFLALSPLIEHHPWFPERTSIMWACVVAPNHLRLRIWERGAGETLACGTGACAAAVAAIVTGRATSPIAIESQGGTLSIAWEPEQDIWMTGPARTVFQATTMMPSVL